MSKEIKGPFIPKEICSCSSPKIESYIDLLVGWGRRWCVYCNKHYKWGVKDV